MNQQDKKIIKNFKRRAVNTRRQFHQFIKAMCAEAKGAEVEDILLGKGMTPCAAREWGSEHLRRANLLKRVMRRKYRKDTSAYGKWGQYGSRIIASTIRDGRQLEFHATKGHRSYQVMA